MSDWAAGVAPDATDARKTTPHNRATGSKPPTGVRCDGGEVTGRPAFGLGAQGVARGGFGVGIACTVHIPALFPLMPNPKMAAPAGGMPRSARPFLRGTGRSHERRAQDSGLRRRRRPPDEPLP